MGADLYINGIFNRETNSGYFRDSYNATSVLWTLDLSWWGDITPLLNKKVI